MSTLRPPTPPRSRWIVVMLIALGTLVLMRMLLFYAAQWHKQLPYSEFYRMVEQNPADQEIVEAHLVDNRIEGRLKDGTSFYAYVPAVDNELVALLRRSVPTFDVQPPQTGFAGILMALGPWLLVFGVLWLVMRSAQGGGRLLSFGKSRARLISPEPNTRVTFDDVAGIDEAKEELQEIIQFLKDPKRFQRLGGKIPKGVLLIGLPGTGKTLLAKAVAGEASVPFYSISGSDFVEMFVGVGASVTGNTPILVKTDAGVRLMPIADFIDPFYSSGEEDRVVYVEGVQTLGYGEKESKFVGSPKRFFGASRWVPVRGVYRHHVAEICEIHYLGGVIQTTADHSVFVRTRNGVHPKAARDLKRGDVLVELPVKVRGEYSPLSGILHTVRAHVFDAPGEPVQLPLWVEDQDTQKKHDFVLANQGTMSQQAIGRAVGVSQATVGHWQRGLHMPRALSRAYTDVELPETVEASPALLKLLGYYTAEGRCNNALEFVFGAHETELHEDCIALMRKVFGLEPSLERTADHTLKIRYGSAVLGRLFARCCGSGAHQKHLPAFLWELPKEYFLAYLAGYARGDGYTTREGKLSVTSVSEQLIRELSWLCAMHGIAVGVRVMTLAGGRILKNRPLPSGRAWNLIIGKTSHPFREFRVLSPAQMKKPYVRKVVVKPYDGYVYDLCGCEHEAFFGGENPVLLHNSRVRDLFEQARRNARQGGKGAIVFIDEIDAVGRQRFAGIGGGHDEREQTLNALLVEMDGFDTTEGIILMAATNRPDVLDPALLRPGRFDRQVVISLPDIVGREAILKVHTRKIKLAKDVDLRPIARQTPGFSGADLANLANEAALLAARLNKEMVGLVELEAAIERVIAGPERKTRVLSEREKKITAYHEAGHALVALLTPETDPLHKVSIIPRGAHALGYTMQLPTEDRYTMSRRELTSRMTVMMGGRVAEELVFNEITTGAQNDIENATDLARRMVCEFGMSDRLGNLTYGRRERQMFLGRDLFEERNYSEQTAVLIDEEVRRLVDTCAGRARQLLQEHRPKLELLASTLLEKEVLDGEEVKRLIGASTPAPPLSTANDHTPPAAS